MAQLVEKYERNATGEVRVSLIEYKGHELMDLRVYYVLPGDERMPTKKGITMSIELYPELKEAILKLGEELGKQEEL